MAERRSVWLSIVLALAVSATIASADVVNPSFETGDLTGWRLNTPSPGGFVVAGDGGSDGDHYLTATADWVYCPPAPGIGGLFTWSWQVSAGQTVTAPAWDTALYVDVRVDGCDNWHVMLTQTISFDCISMITVASAKMTDDSPAPNGFRRYTVDVSRFAGMGNISLDFAAGGYADTVPSDPIEFSVDNLRFVPEPATLAFLTCASSLLLGTRRRHV